MPVGPPVVQSGTIPLWFTVLFVFLSVIFFTVILYQAYRKGIKNSRWDIVVGIMSALIAAVSTKALTARFLVFLIAP
jgi:putative effector of murein hydrolase